MIRVFINVSDGWVIVYYGGTSRSVWFVPNSVGVEPNDD